MATCKDCGYLNLKDGNWWGQYYCTMKREYVSPNQRVCDSVNMKTYDNGGYKRSGCQCYITTIVCTILGYPDNCFVLESMRNLRENYMKKYPKYLPILQEYDQIGPTISESIKSEPHSKEFAQELYSRFLTPCSLAISNEMAYEKAIAIYLNMVDMLKQRYGLTNFVINPDINTPIEDLGKARLRTSIINKDANTLN